MLIRAGLLLLIALATTGCDRITGAADQKESDAEAIGYACRVSLKKPEDCMKENDAQSPNAVLTGWKAADKDISDNTLDPTMGQEKLATVQASPAASAVEEAKPDAKPSEPAKKTDKKTSK